MPDKTVRVRIAVAVNNDGGWNAAGWSGEEAEICSVAYEGMPDPDPTGPRPCEALVWVEADIPIPTPQTIEGKVADD